MSWFRCDDGMLDHPKWIKALKEGGDAALHLWMRWGTWSSRHLTDGVIPAHVAESLPGPRGGKTRERAERALAEASLIHRQSNGDITLHGYLEYNPSRAKALAERQRKTKNKQDQRDRAGVTGDSPTTVPGDRSVPSRPVPSPDNSLSATAPPDQTEPATHTWLPKDWAAPESLYAEAVMAGVTRGGLDEAIKYWSGRKLGGEWRSPEDFLRGKFASIREREEKKRFAHHVSGKARAAAEPWLPDSKAQSYQQRHRIEPGDWNRLIAEQLADPDNSERSLAEQHRVFGQRLANFCRERDSQRKSA